MRTNVARLLADEDGLLDKIGKIAHTVGPAVMAFAVIIGGGWAYFKWEDFKRAREAEICKAREEEERRRKGEQRDR
ncbi:hypothetical protein ACFFX1_14415 [Dactylosporangium sucinum]|uniref:Uncharacterized protein n=1 Tax=Dactylosporangium sucinum TaxID=1424081 RepID=A0A917UCN1_9ACTN|nr:hypothetical protein [Dactylosporangium sucinum]GGM69820.1 hypothetical protein GCM10007977_084460 [Dactylosporangium sucinum]